MPPTGHGRTSATIVVEEATDVDDQLVAAFERLIPQLSSSPPPRREELQEVAASGSAVLLVARDGGRDVVGSLTLVLFRVPTGVRAWIEDVVVDESSRGTGVGEALVREALSRAAAAGARSVDLTSRPGREAANRLYRRLGFEMRETNVYRWKDETARAGGADASPVDSPSGSSGGPGEHRGGR